MAYASSRNAIADGVAQERNSEAVPAFGASVTLGHMGASASAYHRRATGERSTRQAQDERLIERILELHEAN